MDGITTDEMWERMIVEGNRIADQLPDEKKETVALIAAFIAGARYATELAGGELSVGAPARIEGDA